VIGVRPGEKIHEILVSPDEARHGVEYEDMYVIYSANPWLEAPRQNGGSALASGFSYGSDTNDQWLDLDQFKALLQ
jgi:UDP-N-acetylglucosamine 4,6-dehydratase